jgi:prepilin-type N-terminal cleavage/methylation domain-containing protein
LKNILGLSSYAQKMRTKAKPGCKQAFTLMELLVVVGIITLLVSMLLPATNRTYPKATRTQCLNNLKQINSAIHMYADDYRDSMARLPAVDATVEPWFQYKQLVGPYLGLSGPPSASERVFVRPSDTFFYSPSGYHSQPASAARERGFASYAFNGGNVMETNGAAGGTFPGISGVRLGGLIEPSKTVLVCEFAAFTPFSWHDPSRQGSDYRFKNSRNVLSFVDGHANYVTMYWRGAGEAWQYDPPAGYGYKWSDK